MSLSPSEKTAIYRKWQAGELTEQECRETMGVDFDVAEQLAELEAFLG